MSSAKKFPKTIQQSAMSKTNWDQDWWTNFIHMNWAPTWKDQSRRHHDLKQASKQASKQGSAAAAAAAAAAAWSVF